jgi:hypothetical protein
MKTKIIPRMSFPSKGSFKKMIENIGPKTLSVEINMAASDAWVYFCPTLWKTKPRKLAKKPIRQAEARIITL